VAPGEFVPLRIGSFSVWPPVVLAPMAGVTNPPFRTLCRRFGAGLCVSEMINARPLVDGDRKTLRLASFAEDETIRSLQLYGADPYYVGEAARRLAGEGGIDHLDLNFGCPVRKVTSKGGGAAIPLKPRLFRNIVRAAVTGAGPVPVTVKFRIGIDEALQTHLESGRIAQEEGCAAVCLHARTAAQLYSGPARWEAIGELKQKLERIPVLGNGDIWEAHDALRMMRMTGCDGVVIGRGCLGRPWLFRDLFDVFHGREPSDPPCFGEVADIMKQHARMLVDRLGEPPALRAFRSQAAWYTKGFSGSARLRQRLMGVETLEQLDWALDNIERGECFPPGVARVPRGKSGGPQKVALPHGFLDRLDDDTPPPDHEGCADGGG
jgi:nifR3 family TIM-barrel protein